MAAMIVQAAWEAWAAAEVWDGEGYSRSPRVWHPWAPQRDPPHRGYAASEVSTCLWALGVWGLASR
jgi:hypothetical protein